MKQSKDFKSLPFLQTAGIIFVLAAFIVYCLRQCEKDPKPASGFIADKVNTYKDNLNEQRAKIETSTKGKDNTAYYQSEIDRLNKALNIKEKDLLAITSINATLSDSIKVKQVTLDKERNKVWNWEKKYESGSVIKATMSEKDSILRPEIDIALQTTDYVDKGGLFKIPKYYTDIYSPDQNIKVNGVKTYRKETVVKTKRIGIGVQFGYGFGGNFKAAPYVGVGVSYNLFTF